MPWNLFRINLRALRRDRSLTQAAVAEAVGVDRVTYARWETGERKPSVDAISNLAAFFNTSIEGLLGIQKTKGRKR
jgi:transcriptional regulator with XRE-family HTH domain